MQIQPPTCCNHGDKASINPNFGIFQQKSRGPENKQSKHHPGLYSHNLISCFYPRITLLYRYLGMAAHNRTTTTSLPRKRRRPAKSCEQCRERKVRCDLQLPCRACRHARETLTCTYRESPRPRPSQTDVRAVPRSPGIPASTSTERGQSQQQSRGLGNIHSTPVDQRDTADTGTETSGSSLQDLENRLRKAEQQLSELSQAPESCAVSGDLTIPATMPRLRNTAEKTKLFGPSHWMYTAEKVDI